VAAYLKARAVRFKRSGAHADSCRLMFTVCRYCGSKLDRAREPLEVCRSCADSPLCDRCGHERGDHTHVFVKGGGASCSVVVRDFQSLSVSRCDCPGFAPVHGALRDAAFAASGPDPLTLPLRVVVRDD
jgi:hypothetical protein